MSISLSAPLHKKVLASPTTIAAEFAKSPVTRGVLSPVFRRISRPLGPLGRRIGYAKEPGRLSALVTRLNAGDVKVSPPPQRPEAIVSPGAAGPLPHPPVPPPPPVTAPSLFGSGSLWLVILALALVLAAIGLFASGMLLVGVIAIAGAAFVLWRAWTAATATANAANQAARDAAEREAARVEGLRAFGAGEWTPAVLRDAAPAPEFVPRADVTLVSPAVGNPPA